MKRPFSGTKVQIKELTEMRELIRNIKLTTSHGNNVAAKIKCFKGWVATINSLLFLWDELKQIDFKFILTRRLNPDSLENREY